jgi:deoxyribodipyrimidine photo-lyase
MKKDAGGKRKASSLASSTRKKHEVKRNDTPTNKGTSEAKEDGIVLRQFYPPEMTNARALQYSRNELSRPIEELHDAICGTQDDRENIKAKAAVVHWFKCDLRLHDNTALHHAAEMARKSDVPLICLYVVSPQDFQAHLTSPARVDFILRTLETLKEDLSLLDIPLYVEAIPKRKAIPDRILELAGGWGAGHIYANIEYEVDELRREALMTRMALEKGIAFTAMPDTCVVEPGKLSAKSSGNQYAVYTPWYRSWVAYIHKHPEALELLPPPGKNPVSARERFKGLFESKIPDAPNNKQLSDEEKKRLRPLWPAGEHQARERLQMFIEEKIREYGDMRNKPASNGTSMLSVHYAAGTLSARTAVKKAQDANGQGRLDAGNVGIAAWISEVAWRDFYKHVLVHWPHTWFVASLQHCKPPYSSN